MKQLRSSTLADPVADAVLQSHAEAIAELQGVPLASARVIQNVELKPGVLTYVAHQLGRRALMVLPSPPRSTSALASGWIQQYINVNPQTKRAIDASKSIVLAAWSFGASITIDILVL